VMGVLTNPLITLYGVKSEKDAPNEVVKLLKFLPLSGGDF